MGIKKLIKKKEVMSSFKLDIEIIEFTKEIKKSTILNSISFNVKKGTIHGFIGPNGSGKTTTIKSLVGAITLTRGRIFIKGLNSNNILAKEKLGYVPEIARFPKHLDTYHYLSEMAFLRGLGYFASKRKAKEILINLGLWNFRKKNPNSFSSGMKKKIMLAQALLIDPDVLVLDEPTANLDPHFRRELINYLVNFKNQGKTVLICSHVLTELQNIVDEITILKFGEIVYNGVIINKSHSYYKFTVVELEMLFVLRRIIEKNNFNIFEFQEINNSIIVFLPKGVDDVKIITSEAIENRVVLTHVSLFSSDIMKIYEKAIYGI